MDYTFSMKPDYLHAELVRRTTAEETATFLNAAHAAVVEHRANRVLLSIRSSRAIFKVDDYKLTTLIDIAMDLRLRIALSSDSKDVFLSHQYVEMLAKQRGLELRAFRGDSAAREWLLQAVSASRYAGTPALR